MDGDDPSPEVRSSSRGLLEFGAWPLLLVGLLTVYLLSFGPAFHLVIWMDSEAFRDAFGAVYFPIGYLGEATPLFGELMEGYVELFGEIPD